MIKTHLGWAVNEKRQLKSNGTQLKDRNLWKMQEGFCNLMELKALLTIAAQLFYFLLKAPNWPKTEQNSSFFQGKKIPKPQLVLCSTSALSLQCPGAILQGSKWLRSELITPEVLKDKLSCTICYFIADSRTFSLCACSPSLSAHCFSFSLTVVHFQNKHLWYIKN